MGLRSRLFALILFFLSFPILFSQELLKLEFETEVYIRTMSNYNMGFRIELIALIRFFYLFIFFLSKVNWFYSFLRK